MKLTKLSQILFATTIALTTLASAQLVRAQLPTIINGSDNTSAPANNSSAPANNSGNREPQTIATDSSLKVSCQDSSTVVQKGDRQAVMVTWNYSGFGREFTPQKRCQIVSERLQQAASNNGGTFKDLQLTSGTVNSQTVICAVQSSTGKCNRKNLLFTLNPENARNPEAAMQKIFTFAQDGSASLNESASTRPSKPDLNLGNWEKKTFPNTKPAKSNKHDRGF